MGVQQLAGEPPSIERLQREVEFMTPPSSSKLHVENKLEDAQDVAGMPRTQATKAAEEVAKEAATAPRTTVVVIAFHGELNLKPAQASIARRPKRPAN